MTEPLPTQISCADVKQLLDRKSEFVLMDCREEDEFATCRIAGAALWPMSTLAERVSDLGPLQNQRVIVYCHHGMRSLRVTNWLRQQGCPQAQSMSGGIEQWSVEIDPSVPRY